MQHEFKKFPFLTISLYAGIFSGFLLAFVNIIYDFIYRGITKYSFSEILNVSSIIFLSVLLSVAAGIIYFFLVKYIKKGNLLYSALWTIGTALLFIVITSQNYQQPLLWHTDLNGWLLALSLLQVCLLHFLFLILRSIIVLFCESNCSFGSC